MIARTPAHQALDRPLRTALDSILEIHREQYGPDGKRLEQLFADIIALYRGDWPTHEACETGYHNLRHAIEVALVAARMMAGWNQVEESRVMTRDCFLIGIGAALFHDSGYLNDKGDHDGRGGKHTFDHVPRSMDNATRYFSRGAWPPGTAGVVSAIIAVTEFTSPPNLDVIEDPICQTLARIIGTADLIAQMADVDYIEHIHALFEEFQEAYAHLSPEEVSRRGGQIYASAQEMIRRTDRFYEDFVLPRLESFGRMDRYLVTFFGEGRNPYLENITANLSGRLLSGRQGWRRLGDILQDFGMVSPGDIMVALRQQKTLLAKEDQTAPLQDIPFRKRFLAWIDGRGHRKTLGDILLEMEAIDPAVLRKGLIAQVLPPKTSEKLTRRELLFLLQTSMILHNITKDPWIFEQILAMANESLDCRASSILLANPDENAMVVAASTSLKKEFFQGRTIPLDKGLAGWVYRHGRPAVVDNIATDDRYDIETDKRVQFDVQSILTVPLHTNGSFIGVMEFYNKASGPFDTRDIRLMELLANIIAVSFGTVLRLQER